MKRIICIACLLVGYISIYAQSSVLITDSVNQNIAPDPSALLDVYSQTQGVLVPRMTTLQRNGINDPADGLLIFNIDSGCFDFCMYGLWSSLCSGSVTDILQDSTESNQQVNDPKPAYIGTYQVRYDAPILCSVHTFNNIGYVSINVYNLALEYADNESPPKSYVVANDWGNVTAIRSIAVIDSSLYVLLYSSSVSEYRIYLYNANNLSQGGVLVNLTGYSLAANSAVFMASDLENIYLSGDAGNISNPNSFAKFSIISPSVLQYESTTVYGTNTETKYFGIYNGIIFTLGIQSGLMQVFEDSNPTAIYSSSNICVYGNALDGVLVWDDSVYIYNSSYGGYAKLLSLRAFE